MPAQTKPGDACAPPGVRIRVSLPLLSVWIARADLHGPARVADHVAPAIIDRPRCPVAARSVDRLAVALIDHVAGRPRRNDGAGDDRTADDAADDSAGAPTTPLRAGIGRGRGQRAGHDRDSRQRSECLLHAHLLEDGRQRRPRNSIAPQATIARRAIWLIPHHTYTTS